MDLDAVREKLASTRGRQFWRCLEELADRPEFEELLRRKFPGQAVDVWLDPLTRRHFLRFMGASLGLAGLAGCSVQPPPEKIVPQVRAPEQMIPGKPLFFATAVTHAGHTTGLLVESHEGRPTKIEGNPDHPASRGATDIFAQAEILALYDPDRSQTVVSAGDVRTWEDAVAAIRSGLAKQRSSKGAGLRILTEAVVSPTLIEQITAVLKEFPEAHWHQYEPASRDGARQGARAAFGQDVQPHYQLDKADVILSLDADFLAPPGNLQYVRQFGARRAVDSSAAAAKKATMNRLYVAECTPTITGAKADHRWTMRAGDIERFARALAAKLEPKLAPPADGASLPAAQHNLDALASDLQKHRGRCVVVAGDCQSAAVHSLAHAMNGILGNVGQTVTYSEPIEAQPTDPMASLADLTRDMARGAVEMLMILGANAAYSSPADVDFATQLAEVPLSVHLGLYNDETAAACTWHVPAAHFLEAWSDARSQDGTASIVQPLIAPLYGGKSAHELLSVLTDSEARPAHDIVRDHWRRQWIDRGRPGDFQSIWETAVHDGIVPGTELPTKSVTLRDDWIHRLPAELASAERGGATARAAEPDFEIVFRPDPTIFDGRFANNGWLQELPKPLTKLTWDNAVLVSPKTAELLNLQATISGHGGEHGEVLVDVVELQYSGRKLEAPVWILPGHPDGSVTVPLGYGRTRAGQVGTGVGFNAYRLRTSAAPWFDSGLKIRKTSKQHPLACTQYHHRMDDRNLVRTATLAAFQANPTFAKKPAESGSAEHPDGPHPESQLPTLYQPEEHPYNGYKWGMSIDLTRCIGCNACIVACQAENNIPVVGKEQVTRGREMHWIRLDRYYRGEPERPETFFQPVPCMQCENAPCELVCPVGATVHSDEGLNDMVYNRCVGTRYCSNNCPYKVRRFNFLQFADFTTPSLKLLHNPDVTVRSRGVMEKCTYCVQRITQARIEAEKQDRPIRDGEILTACQAVCPAEAIVFGDLNDANSAVSRRKAGPLDYALLEDLNTRPRTTYLAELRNPNPEIAES